MVAVIRSSLASHPHGRRQQEHDAERGRDRLMIYLRTAEFNRPTFRFTKIEPESDALVNGVTASTIPQDYRLSSAHDRIVESVELTGAA
jgi:hypothetical protein